jgi:Integrase core domain.
LKKLKPFVDDGLLRCGGRLTNAKHLDYEHIHPVILPKNHHIVNLLIDHTHAKNLHTGPYLLTAILRRKYWIIGAKDIIRNRVRKCNICFKTNPKPVVPRMGDLPSHRVAETKAFYHTGVDYAGPFYVTWTKRRGVRPIKAYLCLFVCMATKALHLELASDLTTTTFLAALRRFISRRGQVKNLYMDSGSNFIGLSNTMGELYAFLSSNEFKDVYAAELLEHRIVFHFNPPAAPHFGGLWESQVGCVKKHLKKILGTHILTYEMLYSVLTAVESILNSRPLGQLGGTPEDPVVLTPAHFLMQVPTTYLPLGDETPNTIKLEDRYKMVTQMVTTFWKRYSNEYLSTLQERSKWLKDGGKLEVGMLVIIKSENTPVLSWLLGRVIEVFKGPSDGVVRVALVKTNQGVYKRPAVKLCPLPNQ